MSDSESLCDEEREEIALCLRRLSDARAKAAARDAMTPTERAQANEDRRMAYIRRQPSAAQ